MIDIVIITMNLNNQKAAAEVMAVKRIAKESALHTELNRACCLT